MVKPDPHVRMRYPVHALLLVGACWCFYALVLLVSSLFILPCVPLAPALVVMMIGLGGLLSSVHDYARSVATPRQTARVQARPYGQIREASPGAPQHG